MSTDASPDGATGSGTAATPRPIVIVPLDGTEASGPLDGPNASGTEAPGGLGADPSRPPVLAASIESGLERAGGDRIAVLVDDAADLLAADLAVSAPSVATAATLAGWRDRIAARIAALAAANGAAVILVRAALAADPAGAARLLRNRLDLDVPETALAGAAGTSRPPAPFRLLAAWLIETDPEARRLADGYAALCGGARDAPAALAEAARTALAEMRCALDDMTVRAHLAEAGRAARETRAALEERDRPRREDVLTALALARAREADALRAECCAAQARLDAITRSRSWRLTRPVRALARALGRR